MLSDGTGCVRMEMMFLGVWSRAIYENIDPVALGLYVQNHRNSNIID